MPTGHPFRLVISHCIAKGTAGSSSGSSSDSSDGCSSQRPPFPSWVVGAATAAVSLSVLQLATAAESHASSFDGPATLKIREAGAAASVGSQATVASAWDDAAAAVTGGLKKSKAAKKSRSTGDAASNGGASKSGSGSGSGSKAGGKSKVREMEADERAAWASGLPVVLDSVPYSQVVELKQQGQLKHIIKHPKATLGVSGWVGPDGGLNAHQRHLLPLSLCSSSVDVAMRNPMLFIALFH